LGADLTTLAVIIVIVIGFNSSLLQVAGRSVSLALMRALLFSIGPYLLCWGATTGVALAYLFSPPVYLGQIWQLFAWFAAVVLLMLGYLVAIPWRLSGEFAAMWALRNLRHQPIANWETLDGYSVIQTSFGSATMLGDLGAARALALSVGSFLVGPVDLKAEHENRYSSSRFRALKNLITGCAQHIDSAPNQITYYIGVLSAAVMLQAVSVHAAVDDQGRGLFSGVLRELRGTPERLDPFWSGVRHALCKEDIQGQPYLMRFWRTRNAWAPEDPRLIQDIAEGIIRLHIAVWRTERRHWTIASAPNGSPHPLTKDDIEHGSAEGEYQTEAEGDELDPTALLTDLYRNVAELGRVVISTHASNLSLIQSYPLQLLDALHERATVVVRSPAGADLRLDELTRVYLQQRAVLEKLLEFA
jgi:hypothetical protein